MTIDDAESSTMEDPAQASGEVFLLGAGFSRAIHSAMPLMTELSAVIAGRFGQVFGDMDWRSALLQNNVEVALSVLADDQPWLPEPENLRNRAVFIEVSRKLSSEIRNFQVEALASPLPPWLASLVKYWHNTRSAVLTLNYDTLVEKAYTGSGLEFDGGGHDTLLHQDVYAVFVEPIIQRWSASGQWTDHPSFRLAKLHGSINWYYSGGHAYFPELVYDVGITRGWHAGVKDLRLSNAPLLMDKVPLIVPPTSSKSAFFNNETIRANWSFARQALRAATTVYCLGYSLPATDLIVRSLLTETRQGLELNVVSTNEDLHLAYADMLPGVQIQQLPLGAGPIPRLVELLVG